MRAFVTGGAGFVGLALTAELLRRGWSVASFEADETPDWASRALGAPVERFRGDVRDATAVRDAMRAARPDVVFHAAALTPDWSHERHGDAAAVTAVNVGGASVVVEAAAALGVPRVIAISSVAVYGRTLHDCDRLDEATTECRPQSLYGVSKYAAELTARRVGEVRGVEVVTPRLGPLWGPWERRTAVRATPSPPFQMVERARRGESVRLSSATAAPLVASEAAAEAVARLAEATSPPGVVNVGAERLTPLLPLAEAIAGRFGVEAGAGPRPTVALLANDRPPMALDRLRTAGCAPEEPHFLAILDRWLAWLDALPDPAGPFAAP